MIVSELMHQGIIGANISDSLKAVCKIMKENDIGSVPVLENEKAVGFVTDRDIVLACAEEDCDLDEEISVAMSPEIISVTSDTDVIEAARLMEENQISRLLVIDNDNPVGIITLQDLSLNVNNRNLEAEVIEEIKH